MARAIAEITLALAFTISVVAGAADGGEHKYTGVKKCRTCHKKELLGNQYAKWEEGPHAGAFAKLKDDKALEYAKEAGLAGPPSESEECLKCHVTAYDVDAALLPKKGLDYSDGVQCESCHGPGSDFRKKKIMSDHDEAVAKGLWEAGKDEKICTTCHNDDSPAWNPEKYTLADGTKAGFDFAQAVKEIAHPIPEDVKGHYIEIEKKLKAEKRARGEAVDDDEEE